ncbi:hypothetical protein F2P81_012353 [Scophthalmus maximus]|uniref:Uncharacterized protein n=2 Tax=Scophthalmus maximus TaxID=52904 RepID=A0A6A4SPU9_SCOMX|nr:hypothetical protein F2P81_012353 [Scophthalmus maximus]
MSLFVPPGVHILALGILRRGLRRPRAADVSPPLTLNPDSVDTDTDGTAGPEMVRNTSSVFGLSLEVQQFFGEGANPVFSEGDA